MKNIDELKKAVFQSVPNPESQAFRNSMDGFDTYERMALLEFLLEPMDLNYASYVLHKLNAEQERLISEGVPSSQWPEQLQGEDWDVKIFCELMPDIAYKDIELGGWKHALIPDSSKRIANLWRLRTQMGKQ